jgi:hypothetical protein
VAVLPPRQVEQPVEQRVNAALMLAVRFAIALGGRDAHECRRWRGQRMSGNERAWPHGNRWICRKIPGSPSGRRATLAVWRAMAMQPTKGMMLDDDCH